MKLKKDRIVMAGIGLFVAAGISVAFDFALSRSYQDINFRPAAAERAVAGAILDQQAKIAAYDCSVMGVKGTSVKVLGATRQMSVCVCKAQYNNSSFNGMLEQQVFNDTPNTLISYPVSFTTTRGKSSSTSSGYVADMGGGDLAIFVPNNNGTVYFIPARMIDCWKNPFASSKRG